jgi:Polyferredoxin
MKRKYNNWPKYVLQWGTLAALVFFLSGLAVKMFTKMDAPDPETYCPMGGLEAFTTYLVRGSLPCSMSSLQIMMGLALAAAVILFSKLFCGYLCPVGTVEDLLTKLRKALKIKEINVRNGSFGDKALRLVKYGVLFWIVYMTATASELFCKNLDPYYAVATGFKGEITLWMSIVTVALVLFGGLFVRRFWCRYICPLGAISNGLKFWIPMAGLFLLWWVLSICGVNINWFVLLGAFCLLGWALEAFKGRPRFQVLNVIKDDEACTHCGLCNAKCPCGVDLKDLSGRINSVDCTLCGECLAACNQNALRIGVKGNKSHCSGKLIPAILTVLLFIVALIAGHNFELPTIDEKWDVTEDMKLETLKIENLKSVKCYGSSMAFKARMEKVKGVHGVKTYVGSHTVELSYDPSVTTAEKVQEEVFVPSHFRIWSPDPEKLQELKVVTIRTEKMYDKMDLNYLGLQFRTTGKSIFGLESEYNCPLIVKVYMSPDEDLDEEWFREVVNRKVLAMPVHGGGVKETPVDFEFVRMEKGEGRIGIADYLEMMFDPFTAEYNGQYITAPGDTTIEKRALHYEGQPQFIYEVVDQNYEKPIIKRALPYLSNHLSKEEGVIGTYLRLNRDLKPSIQIRYAAPMTADRIWELMTMETWTITYSKDDVREESARMKFDEPGTEYPYETKE